MPLKTVTHEQLQEYYGKILQGSNDLKTSACCCTDEALAPSVRAALSEVNDEVLARFYGCGSPIPPALGGCTVLDLGCGTGRDVFVASRLVGPEGYVIGVDMTEEQLEVARRNVPSQMERFGYPRPNVDFRRGFIEDLAALGIADDSVDVVISNCVINLSPDKRAVFGEIFRVLKPGGELYFSDVFSGRRVPPELHTDPVLHGECLAGALYLEDFRRMLREVGCPDYRRVSTARIDIRNPEIEKKIGMVDFYSVTVRAFKLATLEDLCEDYGQVAVYRGTLPDHPHAFDLDDHHRFLTGKPVPVCGNTASMLSETRFAPHFEVRGDRSVHYGPFDCGPAPAAGSGGSAPPGGCGC